MITLHLAVMVSLALLQPISKEAILETILSEPRPAHTTRIQINEDSNPADKKGGNTPDNVLLKQGIEFYNSEFYERSLQIFERLQKEYPQSPFKDQASLWKARIYVQQQKYANALQELKTIPEQSGEYPSALFMLGRVQQATGRPVDAIEYYTKVAGLYPDQDFADDALILTAQVYIVQMKGNAALNALLKVIKQYPDRETVDDAYYWLGKILSTDSNLKDVELAYRVFAIFQKRADDPAYTAFYTSPLKERVAEDMRRLNAIYFPEQ